MATNLLDIMTTKTDCFICTFHSCNCKNWQQTNQKPRVLRHTAAFMSFL